MSEHVHEITLSTEAETRAIAVQLGALLAKGDIVLLNGPVGAGKTAFARALIQSLLDPVEDVPSPSFTLVQTYDTLLGELWHSDLYRLSSVFDLEELGLVDAFETAIHVIEWPDLLGELTPDRSLWLALRHGDDEDTRVLTIRWTDTEWSQRLRGILNG